MGKEVYDLPDGSRTTDPHAMIAAWRALAEPISKLVGEKASGYDPHVSWSFDDRRFLQLDVWFIKLVNAALAQRAELLETCHSLYNVLADANNILVQGGLVSPSSENKVQIQAALAQAWLVMENAEGNT